MIEILEKNISAKFICGVLEENGYDAYCVGGCVRDALMNELPKDIDITTSALPDQVCQLFSSLGYKVIETGIKHGTVSVILDRSQYEITTMRSDIGYADRRHPDRVSFIKDIKTDLRRRDFTINAMAYSYSTGSLIDPYGGKKDLEAKILRCVGSPEMRFEEDALRILRGIRFASRLGFAVDAQTKAAMRTKMYTLHTLAVERVYSELQGILCGKYAGKIISEYADILSVFIPELKDCIGFEQNSKYHCYDILTHICVVVDNVPPVPYMRFAALFHDIGKPSCYSVDENGEGHFYGHAKVSTQIAERVLSYLKADNETKNKVLFLAKHHDTPLPETETLIKKRLAKYGVYNFIDLIQLVKADCIAQHETVKYRLEVYDNIEENVDKILKEGQCFGRSDLAITGKDLIENGIHEGVALGKTLSYILDQVISGVVPNEKERLIEIGMLYYSKNFI